MNLYSKNIRIEKILEIKFKVLKDKMKKMLYYNNNQNYKKKQSGTSHIVLVKADFPHWSELRWSERSCVCETAGVDSLDARALKIKY